jgi:hypothetical protein
MYMTSLALSSVIYSPHTHQHNLSPMFSYLRNLPLKGPSPVGSPWFFDTANGNWWHGFQGPFSFYIPLIPHFCKPCAFLAFNFLLLSCLTHFSTLKMKVTYSSKMLEDFNQSTKCYIPDYRTFITTAMRTSNPKKLKISEETLFILWFGYNHCEDYLGSTHLLLYYFCSPYWPFTPVYWITYNTNLSCI